MLGTSQRTKLCLFLLLTAAIAIAPMVSAEVATLEQSEQAARNWVTKWVHEHGSWAGVTSPELSGVQDMITDGELVGRCFSFAPNGFVVVPILKEMGPVKMFSDECQLDMTKADGMAVMAREAIAAHNNEYIRLNGTLDVSQRSASTAKLFDDINLADWERFDVSSKVFGDGLLSKASGSRSVWVGPLLTASWHQWEPFCDLVPPGCPVGCVATAAAQIMDYWEWPDEGHGSSGYTWDGGSGGSEYLEAEHWDSYDWANIPDWCPYPDCNTPEEAAAVAELNYEVACSFHMDFDPDSGSGLTWGEILSIAMPAMVNNFLYKDDWDAEYRNYAHTSSSWFQMIQAEVDAGRPMLYGIVGHMIVADGWMTDDTGVNYYHQNYGWDDGHNAWYRIDNLHYPIGGTYISDEVLRFIEPDKSVIFTTLDRIGWAPHDAYFEGGSELSADGYDWDFGDGGSADTDTVTHTYTVPGVYDIGLDVTAGEDLYSRTKASYVVVLADSIYGDTLLVQYPGVNEIQIHATNNVPLSEIIVPIEFGGGDLSVNMNTVSWNTSGLRSASFDTQIQTNYDPMGKRFTIKLENTGSSTDLIAGAGPILTIQFELDSPAAMNDSTFVALDGYSGRMPSFTSLLTGPFEPVTVPALIHKSSCCQGIRGNIDDDPLEDINITDLVYLVTYMFQDGPEPPCMKEANVDGDIFETVDIADLVYLVSFMFQSGPAPAICF